MQNIWSQSNMEIPGGTTFFLSSEMEHFRSTHSQMCDLLENHRPPMGHFRFELATFSDKKLSRPPPHIASSHYFLWENFSAIDDKSAWRLITSQLTTNVGRCSAVWQRSRRTPLLDFAPISSEFCGAISTALFSYYLLRVSLLCHAWYTLGSATHF